MDITPNKLEENEEKETKRLPDLRLITGGKEPPTTTGNWLRDLETGSIFFAQEKGNTRNFVLQSFWLVDKQGPNDKVIILVPSSAKGPEDKLEVDPNRFCNVFSLYYVAGVINKDLDKKEEED